MTACAVLGYEPRREMLILQVPPPRDEKNSPCEPDQLATHLVCTRKVRLPYAALRDQNDVQFLVASLVITNSTPAEPLEVYMPRRPSRPSYVGGDGALHQFVAPTPPNKPRYILRGGVASSWVELYRRMADPEGDEWGVLRASADLEVCEFESQANNG